MKRLPILLLTGLALFGVAAISNYGESHAAERRSEAPTPDTSREGSLQIQSPLLRIEFDRNLHSRVVPLLGEATSKELVPFSASETLAGIDRSYSDFAFVSSSQKTVSDKFGAGQSLLLTGHAGKLQKKVSVTIYNEFPSIAVFDVEYTNQDTAPLKIKGWANHQYLLRANSAGTGPVFWSYQSGSYERRPNWIVPLVT